MTLPGKLCVGILEEDNPLKSYFRFKPLLVAEEEGYQPFDSAEAFAENGCLRIVPDKNESGHFKARMRRIGRYALLDLRAHAGVRLPATAGDLMCTDGLRGTLRAQIHVERWVDR